MDCLVRIHHPEPRAALGWINLHIIVTIIINDDDDDENDNNNNNN